MSKYVDAETKIKKIICEEIDRLPSHFDGEDEVCDSTKDADEILKLNKTVCKALQIADRLEQADADVYYKFCELCKSLTICKGLGEMCGEASGWEDGYNQALADIRGDSVWEDGYNQALADMRGEE